MLIKTQRTILLQIFCKFVIKSKVIFKSMTGPDDTGRVISRHKWVNYCFSADGNEAWTV